MVFIYFGSLYSNQQIFCKYFKSPIFTTEYQPQIYNKVLNSGNKNASLVFPFMAFAMQKPPSGYASGGLLSCGRFCPMRSLILR